MTLKCVVVFAYIIILYHVTHNVIASVFIQETFDNLVNVIIHYPYIKF